MKIAITGSSGLVGSNLVQYFTKQGHTVTRILRSNNHSTDAISWNPEENQIDSSSLEGTDIIIHLAGESIGEGRWTKEKKLRILNSRIQGTRLISQSIANLKKQPKALLCASAIGIYGDRAPLETIDEESSHGTGFLCNVVKEWESSTEDAQSAGIRVIHMRFGVILASKGGALAKMLVPFRLGLGGRIGRGNQMMSWIANDEIPAIIDHLIKNKSITGPVNIVSPNPVSNQEFTHELGKTLHRPAFFPLPKLMVQLLFGEMGEALLLEGSKVIPKKLQENGYSFVYPTLDKALYSMWTGVNM